MRRIDFLRQNLADYFKYDGEQGAEAYGNLVDMVSDLSESGFTDAEIDFGATNENALVITGSFHKVNEAGGHDGYADFRIGIEPMFFGDFHLTEEYANADDGLRDYIGEEVWNFLDSGPDGWPAERKPKPMGLELYHVLFAKMNCDERKNAEWSEKHGAETAMMLKGMENGHLENLSAKLNGKREMIFEGTWDGEPFTAIATPDFREGAKLDIRGDAPAEAIRESLMEALSRDLREAPATKKAAGPKA